MNGPWKSPRRSRKREAEKRGMEEGVVLIDVLRIPDPSEKSSLYLRRAEELLSEARRLFESKDFIQASERAWGACASVVKAYAELKGLEHYRHVQLEEVVSSIVAEREGDKELVTGCSDCLRLHENSYEGLMSEEDLRASLELAEGFVRKVEGVVSNLIKKYSN